MLLHGRLGDGQAQSATVAMMLDGAHRLEFPEQMGHAIGRNDRSRVVHLDDPPGQVVVGPLAVGRLALESPHVLRSQQGRRLTQFGHGRHLAQNDPTAVGVVPDGVVQELAQGQAQDPYVRQGEPRGDA